MLGAAFVTLEVREFADMIARGATPQRSAFLSAFFTLVGCHGLHVTAGLIWLAVMMAQVAVRGFRASVERRLLCFALFWHALDILWVWLFTVVYLIGSPSMTDARYDRAPGDISISAEAKEDAVRRRHLHDRIGPRRDPHGHVVLGRQHVVALGAWHPSRPCRARHRADGRSPGLFPAHHHRTGQYQQRSGAGVRHPHRVPGRRGVALDHDQSERQHDAAARTDEFTYAALNAGAGIRSS